MAAECTCTEREFGRCSRATVRPGRNVNDERDHGDGSDTRPRSRRTSGSLTETRVSGAGRAADPASLNELERAFAERMQNVALEGHFTVEGRERRDGNPELYEISKVTKLEGDRWRFDVHLTYGNVDATLPVVVPIVWAADTPMVHITDFAIPGLGDEFGARVIFYDDRYAGTWDHGSYGGMMYGTIRSMKTTVAP